MTWHTRLRACVAAMRQDANLKFHASSLTKATWGTIVPVFRHLSFLCKLPPDASAGCASAAAFSSLVCRVVLVHCVCVYVKWWQRSFWLKRCGECLRARSWCVERDHTQRVSRPAMGEPVGGPLPWLELTASQFTPVCVRSVACALERVYRPKRRPSPDCFPRSQLLGHGSSGTWTRCTTSVTFGRGVGSEEISSRDGDGTGTTVLLKLAYHASVTGDVVRHCAWRCTRCGKMTRLRARVWWTH